MTRHRAVAAALVGAALAVALPACNGGGGGGDRANPATTTTVGAGTPIDVDQAGRVAGALFTNGDLGGADLTVVAPFAKNLTARMEGVIDWKAVVGHVTLQVSGQGVGEASTSAGQTLDLWWNKNSVTEETPGLPEAMAAAGLPPLRYDRRPPEPTKVQADRLLAIITGLASPQRDNPLLLLQGGKATFLRADQVDGVAVEVFRFNANSRLWIGKDDGVLRRFELDVSGYAGPVVIDLRNHGAKVVQQPPSDQVVDVREISEIYRRLTSR